MLRIRHPPTVHSHPSTATESMVSTRTSMAATRSPKTRHKGVRSYRRSDTVPAAVPKHADWATCPRMV